MSGYLKLRIVEGKSFKIQSPKVEVKSRGFLDKKSKKEKVKNKITTPPPEEEVSDITPIVQLKFKTQSCSTKPCQIRTNEIAKWGEVFEFKIEKEEYSFILYVYNGEIKEECLLGESRIGIITFKDQKKLDNWFPFYMKNKKKFIFMGEIHIIGKYVRESEYNQEEDDPDFFASKPQYTYEYENNHGNYLNETGFVLNNNSEDYYDNTNNINIANSNSVTGVNNLSCSPSDMNMLNQQNIDAMKNNNNNDYQNNDYQDNNYQNNDYQNNNYQNSNYQSNNNYQNNNNYQGNNYQGNNYQNNNYQNSNYQNNNYQNSNYQSSNYQNGSYQDNNYQNSNYQNDNSQEGFGFVLPNVYNNNNTQSYNNNASLPPPNLASPNNRMNKNNNNNLNVNNNGNFSHIPSFLNPQIINRNKNNNINSFNNGPMPHPMNSGPMNSRPMNNSTTDSFYSMPGNPSVHDSVNSQDSNKPNGSLASNGSVMSNHGMNDPMKGDSIYSNNEASAIENSVLPLIPDELSLILSDIPSPDLDLPQEEIMEQLEFRLKYKQYNQRVNLNSKQISEFKAWSEKIQSDDSISHSEKKRQLRIMKEKHSSESKQLASDHQRQLELLHDYLETTKNAINQNKNNFAKVSSVSSQGSQQNSNIQGSVHNSLDRPTNNSQQNSNIQGSVHNSLNRPTSGSQQNTNVQGSVHNSLNRPTNNSLDRPNQQKPSPSLSSIPTDNMNNNSSISSVHNDDTQNMNNTDEDFGFSLKYVKNNNNSSQASYSTNNQRPSVTFSSSEIVSDGNNQNLPPPQDFGFSFGPITNNYDANNNGYNNSYNNGYNNDYNNGYNNGYSNDYNNGYNNPNDYNIVQRPTKSGIVIRKNRYYMNNNYEKNYERSNIKFKGFKVKKSYAPTINNYSEVELKKKPEEPKKSKFAKKITPKVEEGEQQQQQQHENVDVPATNEEHLSDDEPLINIKNKLDETNETSKITAVPDETDDDDTDSDDSADDEKKFEEIENYNFDDISFEALGVDVNVIDDNEFEQLLSEYGDINERIQKMKTVNPKGLKRILTKKLVDERKKIAKQKLREEDSDNDDDDDDDDEIELQHESTIKASDSKTAEGEETTSTPAPAPVVEGDDEVTKIIGAIDTDDEDDEFKEMLNEYDDINCQLQKMNTVKANITISNSLKDFYKELGISPTIRSPTRKEVIRMVEEEDKKLKSEE